MILARDDWADSLSSVSDESAPVPAHHPCRLDTAPVNRDACPSPPDILGSQTLRSAEIRDLMGKVSGMDGGDGPFVPLGAVSCPLPMGGHRGVACHPGGGGAPGEERHAPFEFIRIREPVEPVCLGRYPAFAPPRRGRRGGHASHRTRLARPGTGMGFGERSSKHSGLSASGC